MTEMQPESFTACVIAAVTEVFPAATIGQGQDVAAELAKRLTAADLRWEQWRDE